MCDISHILQGIYGGKEWGKFYKEKENYWILDKVFDDMFQDDHCATRRIIFTYPMIAYTDMEDGVKTEVMEIATNACEKYLNDNQSVILLAINRFSS